MPEEVDTSIALFDADPDLLEHADERIAESIRRRSPKVNARRLPASRQWVAPSDGAIEAPTYLVTEGWLLRRLVAGEDAAFEILGRGDVTRPLSQPPVSRAAGRIEWRSLTPSVVAFIDRLDREPLRSVPAAAEALLARAAYRASWNAQLAAIAAVRPIPARLHKLLWYLAERWGRLRNRERVWLPIPLSHDLLARICSCRRQALVSAATALRDDRLGNQARDLTWELTAIDGSPPPTRWTSEEADNGLPLP